MARKSFVLMVAGTVIFFLCSTASADVPQMINYQGKLVSAEGGCLNDTVQMTFSIYPDTLGPFADWTETQDSVIVKEGIFNALLGSKVSIPASVFDGSTKYLGVKVESDPEMTPLKSMVTTAYAFRSQGADTAEYARVAMPDDDWVIDGNNIYREQGNVGIGTTTPTEKLDVSGNIKASGTIMSGSSITIDGTNDKITATSGTIDFDDEDLTTTGTAEVAGFKMAPGTAGYVLTSDANGVGTWQAGAGDNDWTFRITDTADTTLVTGGMWGIARYGNVLYGNMDSTHVNLGVKSITGTSGENYKYCTVGGGVSNTASGNLATVGGGWHNIARGGISTVAGGYCNFASDSIATVGGGFNNSASGECAFIGGGLQNHASSPYATVGGGRIHTASADWSTVGGGDHNTASGSAATVGGGSDNMASGSHATVAGGEDNVASNFCGTVGGGFNNVASGFCATVAGGHLNTAAGSFSIAAGSFVRTSSSAQYTLAFGYSFETSTSHAAVFYDSLYEMKVGIQTTSPTARLDVYGSTGYNQIRMRTSYTPTGTNDPNGNVGDIAWDDNYFYVKTSAGWKKTALTAF